ncbi:KR domain-containing protein [Methylobacterium currus]|uniref:KR domain-containing protein n=1 Tax=Methylobacterium currus TaxID=2051553 RepID=A0A2R4WLI2_9HYPH|nr:SDR family oxidoreductase [Methylobacterium currus]AWB22411.1 KR domain-containing protein [Methylobacterium currus]UHC17941.1 SDR family oxidoreductase [Methylobacterium currus]
MRFRDRAILVTGASRGIGAAIATAFAAEGGLVIVNYRENHAAAEAVAERCRALGGPALTVAADVTDPAAVAGLAARITEEVGRLDAVVNNAFAPYRFDPDRRVRFRDVPWDSYQRQFDGAVRAAYTVIQAMLPLMTRRSGAAIVNLASDLVARPSIPYHDYTTAKAALVGFSRNLAAELGPIGVRVNCVAPGLVTPTEASRDTPEEVREALIAQTPLRRLATPEDVAGPVLFLAGEESRFVTGQVLYVDGGLVMG